MPLQTVKVTAKDTQVPPVVVQGVLVRVFTAAGVFTVEGTTNASGDAEFQLNAGTYNLRFFYSTAGYSIKQPQSIEVKDPPPAGETNNFEVTIELFQLPVATDSRFCRCSGYFLALSGTLLKDWDVIIRSLKDPILLTGDAVAPGEIRLTTDKKGYAQVDLPRKARVRYTMQGIEAEHRDVIVPDRSSANLLHVLFPIVSEVVFTPATLSMAVGVEKEADWTVKYLSGLELKGEDIVDQSPVLFKITENGVAALSVGKKLKVKGLKVGTATVTPEAKVETYPIIRIPKVVLAGSLAVTVV